MSQQGEQTQLGAIVAIVEDLIQDWGHELESPIDADTRLFQDLDFASVDIIQLCVAIEESHGRKLGFQDLLMSDGSYVSELTIGEVIEFVNQKTNGNDQ